MSSILTTGILQQQSNLKRQYALSFDGVDDYVDINKISEIIGNNSRSFVFKFRWDSVDAPTTNCIFGRSQGTGNGTEFNIYFDSETTLRVGVSGGKKVFNIPSILDGKIHEIVLLFSGTNVSDFRLFFDNSEVNDIFTVEDVVIDTEDGDYNIGQSARFPQEYMWNGLVMKTLIYNKSLTESEVDNIYLGNIPSSGIIRHYDYTIMSGTVLPDLTDTQDGTIYGATWVEL